MKTIKKTTILLYLLVVNIVALAQQNTRPLLIAPEKPMAGETVTISYNPSGTTLEAKKDIFAVIYMYCDFKWVVKDLDLKKKNSDWTGSYILPQNCAFFAFKFKADKIWDTGKKMPYECMTIDKKTDKQLPGAYYAWGMLRNTTLQEEAPKYTDSSGLISDQEMLYWIEQERKYHPESHIKVFYSTLAVLKKMGKENVTEKIEKELKVISTFPNIDEQILMNIEKGYRSLLNDSKRADSVKQVILNKYPKGITARDKVIYHAVIIKDLDLLTKALNQLNADFPVDEFKNIHTRVTTNVYSHLYTAFTSDMWKQIFDHNSYKILDELLITAPLDVLNDYYYRLVDVPIIHNGPKKELYPHAKMIMDKIIAVSKDTSLGESYFYSPKEWEQHVVRLSYSAYYLQALLLKEIENYKEAYTYATKLENVIDDYAFTDLNELYVFLLDKNGKQAEIIPFIKNAAGYNKVSPRMIEILKKNYSNKHGNENGFDTYFHSLTLKEVIATQREEINASLIKKEIPPFKLESINGSIVDLAAQKGKIVVLDFWATWCAPCKAALPGMQMVVDKYKNDPNVALYFVDTDELAPNYRDAVKQFLKEKNYTLNVLFDAANPKTKALNDTYSRYSTIFNRSGIPWKIIIDKNGFVRWQVGGYNGSPSALADEISYVIELLKAEAVN
jgi:thiol-disulfide isomerase/thioredoxin